MKLKVWKITYKGQPYVLQGDDEEGGAFASLEDFKAGRCSYACLFPDRTVMRFKKVIGGLEDIEWFEEIEVEVDEVEHFYNTINHESWPD